MTLSKLRGVIKSQIKNRNPLTKEYAMYYLYLVLKEVKEKLNRDWTSYGTLIGSENSEICPWDLVEISIEDGWVIADETTVEASSQDDQWMVIYILSIYRLQNTDPHRRRSVIAEIVKKMKVGDKSFIFSALAASTQNWQFDRTYLKMIAAVDMFFTRFPLNSWAEVKVGTVGSRFKGCGALLAVEHMKTMLGISYETVQDWIFFPVIDNEMRRIMQDGEEIGEEFSYFPYQLDLGLVTRSAYSVNLNPSLFFFAHSTCALLGSERSKNAKLPREGNRYQMILNVIIMAYAFSKKLGNSNNTKDVKVLSTASGIPQNTDAKAWFKFMNTMNRYHPPEDMVAFVTEAKIKMGAVQNGTVGKYVKESYNI